MCVCVCERERERERGGGGHSPSELCGFAYGLFSVWTVDTDGLFKHGSCGVTFFRSFLDPVWRSETFKYDEHAKIEEIEERSNTFSQHSISKAFLRKLYSRPSVAMRNWLDTLYPVHQWKETTIGPLLTTYYLITLSKALITIWE